MPAPLRARLALAGATQETVHLSVLDDMDVDGVWGQLCFPNYARFAGHRFYLNVADTELRITGSAAQDWMRVAQAFAGPPGEGRRPGQFAKDRRHWSEGGEHSR